MGDTTNSQTEKNLYKECILMFEYATGCGKKLPEWILNYFNNLNLNSLSTGEVSVSKDSVSGNGQDNGVSTITNGNELPKIYNALVDIVAPAAPLTIEYTKPTVKAMFMWGSLCMPFIRGMWVGCLLFLLGFIITGFQKPFYLNIDDKVVLQLHLLFAAGLGSYFYALYAANKYAVDRTFDPKYVTFYFNRIIIGIVSGLILTNIITDPESIADNQTIITGSLTPTLVAILGGFSSEAVMRILNRIMAMLITLVQGETKDIIDSKEQEMKAKSEARIIKVKLNAASELFPIYNNLKDKVDSDTYTKFKQVMEGLVKVNGEV